MISVVIPVYKQTELFLKNLKINLSHLQNCEVIIVNDHPQEKIKERLKDLPVILIENKRNLGFGGAANIGIKKTQNRFVMLLNSDTILEDESFKLALNELKKNKNLFAVSFAQKEKDGSIVGKNRIFWQNGFIRHSAVTTKTKGINAWAEGGACILDKQKFNRLNGFDDIYSPFYWEDIDLSYRAWKSGYEILFNPNILVKHFHESTIGRYFETTKVETIAYRNQIIFMWKNITDPGLFWKHLLLLKLTLLLQLLKGNVLPTKAYLQALQKLPRILKKRRQERKLFRFTDLNIINKFNV